MQRKQTSLVPIGEVVGELEVPVTAIPAASPQARHHFTLADQVDQLRVHGDPTMTDKQQGWNDALNIVIDKFCDVAWQNGLVQERERAAADMETLVEHKCRGKSEDYQQTMADVVGPFCKMLNGISQPEPPFNTKFPEAERQGRNDALEIVLDEFRGFAHGTGLKLEWTCSEIADDMEKLVEYEDRGKSEDYQQTMADVVRPFYKMLKSEPQRKPPFNT